VKLLSNLDLVKNQLLNAKFQMLATDPVSPEEGQFWYNSTAKTFNYYDGTAVQALTAGSLSGIFGTAPIVVTDNGNDTLTISINAATGSLPGSMSAADKTKLDAATATNTGSTLVLRDGSGNFSATTVTANLTGTASNAALLNNNNAAHYLDRGNHTGSQAASTISDFDTQVRTSRLDQMAAPTADVSLNSRKITNLATPTADTDAATKAYADSLAQGLDVKQSVRVATTTNIANLNSITTVDGVTLATGNRVLVKNQTTESANGIYTWATNALTRATDADTSAKVTPGLFVFVEEGTTNADTGWVLSTNAPITLGTTALVFTQFSGAGAITAGNGLTQTGTTINVVGTAGRISVAADSVDIDAAYAGQNTITTVGTIATGTWAATDVGVAHGGTGASDAPTARANLGAVGKYAVDVGNNSNTSFVITHNLNSRDVQAVVYLNSGTYEQVVCDVEHTSVNTVTLRFAVAPTSNQYRVVVVG
jgi:hypothetical protein